MMYKYLYFIVIALLTIIITLLSVYIYELHCSINLLKDNYNELLLTNTTLIKELSNVNTRNNSIDSLNYLLAYLPYILGACAIAYIGVYEIPATLQYIQSWNLYCSNLIPSSFNNYIYPYIQSSLNVLNPTNINNFFIESVLNLFVSTGFLKAVPTQHIPLNINNSVSNTTQTNIINTTPLDNIINNSSNNTSATDLIVINANTVNTEEIQSFLISIFNNMN